MLHRKYLRIDTATGKEQKYSMGLDGNIFDDKGNVVQEWDSTFTTQAYGFAGYGQALAGEEDEFDIRSPKRMQRPLSQPVPAASSLLMRKVPEPLLSRDENGLPYLTNNTHSKFLQPILVARPNGQRIQTLIRKCLAKAKVARVRKIVHTIMHCNHSVLYTKVCCKGTCGKEARSS